MKHILTAVIIVLALALAAIIIIPTVKASRPIEVTVLLEPTSSSLPFFFGQEQGYFQESQVKLRPQMKPYDDPKEAIKALVDGEAEFALLPWTEALAWMSENPQDTLLCLFTVEYRTAAPQDGFFLRKGLTIKAPKDFGGKTIAISKDAEVAAKAIVATIPGVDPATVTLKVYPREKLIEAVANKEVDMALVINPYYTLATQELGPSLWEGAIFAQLLSSPYPASGLFTTKKVFKDNPMAVKRMNTGIYMTLIKFGQQSDTVIAQATAREFGIEPELLIGKLTLPNYIKSQDIDKVSIQVLADKLELFGATKKSINVEDMGIIIKQEDLRE